MSEKQNIETKQVGFSFSISIEKELRSETGAKYPDKTVIKASLEGNADTYEEVVAFLSKAKTELLSIKPEETKKEENQKPEESGQPAS